MATLPRLSLPTTEQIRKQRMNLDQIQALEIAAVRNRDLSRLERPNDRPQTLEFDSAKLLITSYQHIASKAAMAPVEVAKYLYLALFNLRAAIYEAVKPYPELKTITLPTGDHTGQRLMVLTGVHLRYLEGAENYLKLLTNTAPVEVALHLIRTTDWIAVTLQASDRADEMFLINASPNDAGAS